VKKTFYFLIMGAFLALSGCSKSDDLIDGSADNQLKSAQNVASRQATKIIDENYEYAWDCPCTGEWMVGTFTSVGIENANGIHWSTKGTAVGYDEEGGTPTGHVYDIKNVENYIYVPRDNGSWSPDKGVWTMQIRLNGKLVALTHPSYEIKYDSNGGFAGIIWSGFWCSPN
jgi:hypothetical protein